MPEPKPIEGDSAYEVLGVSEATSYDEIASQRDALVEQYRERVAKARRDSDREKFREATQAIENIQTAFEALVVMSAKPHPQKAAEGSKGE